MEKYHAKSPCCGEKVHKFGNRRRQCSQCKKTWRIRKKKVGRKIKREDETFVLKYLHHEIPSLYAKARAQGITDDKLRNRLLKSREKLLRSTHWPTLPRQKPLIAIADAMVCYIDSSWYTFYFILIKKPHQNYAIVAQPYVREGTEVWLGWCEAFSKLPLKTMASIVALVCDGHTGLVSTAKREGWILQRCHFHLIARLQTRRSKWKLTRHGEEGKILYGLVQKVLTLPASQDLSAYLEELRLRGKITKTRDLKTVLIGFTKHYQDYRSYLTYPELNLPKTSNAIESMIGLVQQLKSRSRGFRTISALTAWVNAVLKNRKRFTCNGFHQPN